MISTAAKRRRYTKKKAKRVVLRRYPGRQLPYGVASSRASGGGGVPIAEASGAGTVVAVVTVAAASAAPSGVCDTGAKPSEGRPEDGCPATGAGVPWICGGARIGISPGGPASVERKETASASASASASSSSPVVCSCPCWRREASLLVRCSGDTGRAGSREGLDGGETWGLACSASLPAAAP